MYIKTIHIDSFGGVRGTTLELSKGLNIIEGGNESGKSSVAMFIKFIFYGLSGRGVDGAMSERRRYVNWETGSAAGYIILVKGDVTYRISRELYVSDDAARERVSIINEETGEKMFKGEVPGMALLRMPEQMFYNSVFVRQLSDASIDGTGMSEAIENILYSGDEEVSTRRAVERLEKTRKVLLHKNGNGGRIYDIRREKARLEAELKEAMVKNAEIMDIESAVADSNELIASRERNAAHLDEIVSSYDKLRKLDALTELEKLESEQNKLKAMLEGYRTVEEIERDCDELRGFAAKRREAEMKLRSVRVNINTLDKTLPPPISEEEKERDRMDVAIARAALAKKKSCFGFSLALYILAVFCGAGAAFLFSIDKSLAMIAGGAAAVMLVVATILLGVSISSLKRHNSILDKWNAMSADEVEFMGQEKIRVSEMLRSEDSEYGKLHRDEIAYNNEREAFILCQREAAAKFVDEAPDTDTMTENALAAAAATVREINIFTR
ncbi:MAG: AAA family ATPase, partial [Clostridia bacterium]|nr:AAA family ATPase [Clostridia bacterium]